MDSRATEKWEIDNTEVHVVRSEVKVKYKTIKCGQAEILISFSGWGPRIRHHLSYIRKKEPGTIEEAMMWAENSFVENPLPEKSKMGCQFFIAGYSSTNKAYVVQHVGDYLDSPCTYSSSNMESNYSNFQAMGSGGKYALDELKKLNVNYSMGEKEASNCIMKSITKACNKSNSCGGLLRGEVVVVEKKKPIEWKLFSVEFPQQKCEEILNMGFEMLKVAQCFKYKEFLSAISLCTDNRDDKKKKGLVFRPGPNHLKVLQQSGLIDKERQKSFLSSGK